jgi:hypothetical protein
VTWSLGTGGSEVGVHLSPPTNEPASAGQSCDQVRGGDTPTAEGAECRCCSRPTAMMAVVHSTVWYNTTSMWRALQRQKDWC